MLRGYRSILIALAGLALVGAAPQPSGKDKSEEATPQAEPRQSAPAIAPSPAQAVEQLNSPILAEPCEPGQNNRRSDLCAQWKAADAAGDAAWWAMVGTIIAAIGTAGLYWQIKLTREAVQDTSEATEAMREANRLTREAQERQLRPYITFVDPEIEDNAPFSRDTKLHFAYKNFGQTPATQLLLSLGAQSFTPPLGNEEVWLEHFALLGVIAPGDLRKDFVHNRDVKIRDLSEISEGRYTLFLRMRLEYWWPGGNDSHEVTLHLVDPATNNWTLLTSERRHKKL